jgi:hypothetical protein
MKTTLDWYKHEATASESPKFITLRASPYGLAGEARFWILNGLIARSDNCRLDLSRKFAIPGIAEKLYLKPEELEPFLCFLRDECELVEYQSGLLWTERLLECLAEVMPERIRKAKGRGQGADAPRTGRGRSADETAALRGASAEKWKKSADKTHILDSDSDSESDKETEQNGEARPPALRSDFADGDFGKREMGEAFAGILSELRVESEDRDEF